MKSIPFLRGTKKSLTDQPFINNEDEQQREHDFLCIKAFYCLSLLSVLLHICDFLKAYSSTIE